MSDQKAKPVLDEQALEKLLEAAFVLQEHNREQEKLDLNLELHSSHLREQEAKPSAGQPDGASADFVSKADYTATLAQIVETQRQIQFRHLDLENAMSLVAERIVSLTGAAGTAIAVLDAKKVRYRAVSGAHALAPGTELPMEKAICHACIHVGQVIRCKDINTEFLFDVEDSRRRGIQSLIAVPVYRDGEIAGALELYFDRTNAFTEQDVHSCQLMAGLVTEAFARDDELTWKKSLAVERATMLEALEKLKPNLAALVGAPVSKDSKRESANPSAVPANTGVCRECGHEIVADEQFCGKCGTPKAKVYEAPRLQSKVASLWQMQQVKGEDGIGPSSEADIDASVLPSGASSLTCDPRSPDTQVPETLDEELLASLHADFEADAVPTRDESPEELILRLTEPEISDEPEAEPDTASAAAADTSLVKAGDSLAWSSAAKAKDFLEHLAVARNKSALARFWNARRGYIYLAVAVILVAVVIRWGVWSSHAVSATGGQASAASPRRPAPDADLSLFDKMLIRLGLAEPPETPEYHGNPDTEVWVDLHTALYYCPGTDLYGKTPKGKYTTQKDAQLDQFEPAYRKACD